LIQSCDNAVAVHIGRFCIGGAVAPLAHGRLQPR
jgi:hypothetical protein